MTVVAPDPRIARSRAAVLDATVALLGEVGHSGTTIEAIAERSGVAKTTIYRHWPTKQALLIAAVRSCLEYLPTPNTGDVRADLIACFDHMVRAGLGSRVGKMLTSLLDGAERDPELDRLLRAYMVDRSLPVRTVLQLAQYRGELPADLDLLVAAALFMGPVSYRKTILREPITEEYVAAIVDAGLRALQAGALSESRS
jgi:AcrR family transcriptional regulator